MNTLATVTFSALKRNFLCADNKDSFGETLTEAQVSGDANGRCEGKRSVGEVPEHGRKLTFLSGVCSFCG